MRIAMIAPHFAEYATRLALALAEQADVLLVTEVRNERAECDGLQLGGAILRAGYRGDYALRTFSVRAFVERRKIYDAINAFAPDVIHVQEQGDVFMAALVERYAASLPVVVTIHDPKPHSGADFAVAERFAKGLARIRAAAHAHHVHGTYCAKLLREVLGTPKPVVETAHGIILEPGEGQIETPGNTYLFFGRMEAYKGVGTMLDAIDLLANVPDMRFVFAGRGPEIESWRARIAANPAVELIERFLAPEEAIRQFQRARAVLVPYRDATQSGVVSAAFGNGRPVIASRVGGLVDAVTDGADGLLVPPDDPAALAAAIGKMHDPATGARLTEGARRAAKGAFAWRGIAERLLGLHAELIGARRLGRGHAEHPPPQSGGGGPP